MKAIRRLLILFAGLACGASAQIIVTPLLVTAQGGGSIFCGLKKLATAPLVQLYCFQTITTAFDTLSWNVVNYPTGPAGDWNTSSIAQDGHTISLQWRRNANGISIDWQVKADAASQSGTF